MLAYDCYAATPMTDLENHFSVVAFWLWTALQSGMVSVDYQPNKNPQVLQLSLASPKLVAG